MLNFDEDMPSAVYTPGTEQYVQTQCSVKTDVYHKTVNSLLVLSVTNVYYSL